RASTYSHPEGCSYTSLAPVGAPPSVRTGRAHIRTRGGCSYTGPAPVGAPPSVRTGRAHIRTRGVLLHWPGSRRSTALGANRASTFSHPEGAPTPAWLPQEHRPRCEPGEHIFAPGGSSYTGLAPVGAPPSVRTEPAHFRTRRVLLHWPGSRRSTALGANRASTFSHLEGCSYTGPAP